MISVQKFSQQVKLIEKTELEKIALLAFFKFKFYKQYSFLFSDILKDLEILGQPISNPSRLKSKMKSSKVFKKAKEKDAFLLTAKSLQQFEKQYPLEREDDITSSSEVLDETFFCQVRGYLDRLIFQINHTYSEHCYDACAVLMRRFFEIILILTYEHYGIQDEIKQQGDYMMLEGIVANAINNKTLNLSRSRNTYDEFRKLGNFAAHKIYYNTRKSDIDKVMQNYRVALEELYYKSGLKK